MGANDSKRISSGAPALDVITTIQRRTAVPQLDPCLERLQQLRVVSVFFCFPLCFPPNASPLHLPPIIWRACILEHASFVVTDDN